MGHNDMNEDEMLDTLEYLDDALFKAERMLDGLQDVFWVADIAEQIYQARKTINMIYEEFE